MRLAKRRLRDLRWAFKARSVRNPPLPPGVRSLLFVCLGNICRSPFAAALAELRLQQAGIDGITCRSAGIRPSAQGRPPDEACEVAATFGLAMRGHESQPVTPELVQKSDLIVVMEWWQLDHLRSRFPAAAPRTILLSLLDEEAASAYERCNIEDPFGRPLARYEACFQRIDRAVQRLAAAIRPV